MFEKMLFPIALIVLSVAVYGCHVKEPSTEKLRERIGAEIVETLKHAEGVVFFKENNKKELTNRQLGTFRKLILNDENYYFDRTKKCAFLPEILVIFKEDQERIVWISLSSKQIKFVDGRKEIIIDCDPMGPVLESEMKKYLM